MKNARRAAWDTGQRSAHARRLAWVFGLGAVLLLPMGCSADAWLRTLGLTAPSGGNGATRATKAVNKALGYDPLATPKPSGDPWAGNPCAPKPGATTNPYANPCFPWLNKTPSPGQQ